MAKRKRGKTIATLKHDEASRKNIPTAEFRSVMDRSEQSPVRVAYQRRNRDLDPQLVWRGKDEQDWSDLVVQAPPLYIQEKEALKTTLKAEIDPDAWASLHSDLSRPFDRPESGRIAVKVINHLGDEVKVFRV